MKTKTDCFYFNNDRPCVPHKKSKVDCDSCDSYKQIRRRLVLIKLDEAGDVLRTTAVIPGLLRRHPDTHVCWITKPECAPLLLNNPGIQEILPLDTESLPIILCRHFDEAINLDVSLSSASILKLISADVKRGFIADTTGVICATSPAGTQWLSMSRSDNLKKQNCQSYQRHMLSICDAEFLNDEIWFKLTPEEITFREGKRQMLGLSGSHPIFGFNIGAGSRWPLKAWNRTAFEELGIQLSRNYPDCAVLLLGGKNEQEKAEHIQALLQSETVHVQWIGTDNTIRQFGAIVDLCDVVVTGDTFAMHLATALRKKVVALFGPTSATEIEDYGRMLKVVSNLDCQCCYTGSCGKSTTCMDDISVDVVMKSIRQVLET